MVRNLIRSFLNKRNYEIIKQVYRGDKFPNLSNNNEDYYCETPIGNYFLPLDSVKDPVVDTIIRGKIFEPENIELAKRFIKKNSTVLDIGANFGQMSIEFSKLVGSNGIVYSFEAQETVFKYLEKNISSNKCKNVITKFGAVYNEDGKVLIFPDPKDSYTTYSSNAINPTLSEGKKVTTFTIDSLKISTPISFMKVDIQGSDLFAIQGARDTIMKHRMPIFFEFEQQFQHQFNTTFQNYLDFLRDIDYVIPEVVEGINYLALPREKN